MRQEAQVPEGIRGQWRRPEAWLGDGDSGRGPREAKVEQTGLGRRGWLWMRPQLGACPGSAGVGSLWVSTETRAQPETRPRPAPTGPEKTSALEGP